MALAGNKKWFQSNGVLAGIAAAILGIASAKGIPVVEGDVVTLLQFGVAILTQNWIAVLTSIAGVWSAWGRIRATRKIA